LKVQAHGLSSGLRGSYQLDDVTIERIVTRTSPGIYALGHSKNGKFIFRYVGRSDKDVRDRLKEHVDDYRLFKFEYASSRRAFEKECLLWHLWGGQEGLLDSKHHPERPADKDWSCPECDIFSLQAAPPEIKP
jgi:hypothetical protein